MDFLQCSIYKDGMNKKLQLTASAILLVISGLTSGAVAQTMSPIQQYLQSETGYAPPVQAYPQAQAQVPTVPYTVAQTPAAPYGYYAPQQTVPANEAQHLNSGVTGMNY